VSLIIYEKFISVFCVPCSGLSRVSRMKVWTVLVSVFVKFIILVTALFHSLLIGSGVFLSCQDLVYDL